MSELDYDALQRLADAATEGPWEAGDVWVYTEPVYPDDRRLSNVLGMDFADPDRAEAERERGLRNAEFIAAARDAVPALLDRVRELEAELANAKSGWNSALRIVNSGSEIISQVGAERDAALSTIAAIEALLPGPRTWVESLSRMPDGSMWPRTIDVEKIRVAIALGSVPSTGEGNE